MGGTGNDTYILQNAVTVITENASEGTDTVQVGASYTLGTNLENLTLTGTSALKGTGNTLDNVLTGNSAIDTLVGGTGNDTYILQNAVTVITENASEGTDTVQIGANYTLGTNIENLTLTGTTNLAGTGNSLTNVITGNTGDNTLDGGTGADTLIGGTGNDTYVVDNVGDIITENVNEGTDTVQASINYTLGANLESLTLTGSNNLTGTGNTGDNVLTGNAGSSTLIGGTGNDTYLIQNATTTLTENASEGTDTVQTIVSYTLGTNLENLTLTGNTALTGTGNSLNNVITGNTAASTLAGGLGNDTYIVSSSDNVIVENASEGIDTVQSSINYTLASNVENLTLTGSDILNGTGNSQDNFLTGNGNINTLVGLDGNDTLDGGAGADFLYGGLGNDTYIVDNLGDVVVENASEGTDTVQASVSYTLSSNVENLTLTGTSGLSGTGNSFNNTLTGNSGDNLLDGGIGADTLVGGTGNDTYVVDNAGDVVTENASAGTDTVDTSINYTLGANVENLVLTGSSNLTGTGNTLDNILIGNTGTDALAGGTGNDTYILQNTSTAVTENASAGTDTLQIGDSYTLGANLENLILTGTGNFSGTGNSSNNSITGNTGDNTLDGSTGADTLIGGFGNDTYIVDNARDVVSENSGEGIDTVQASVSYTLSGYVENLTLTGTANINGTGSVDANYLLGNSGNNSLSGSAGDDTLDGGTGKTDTLVGGTGNDLYLVNSASTVLVENGSEGIDTVQSSISYTLANYFENLTLTGTGNLSGTGTIDNNLITGNSGNNVLTGLAGNDTIDGGAGADTLIGGTGDDVYLVDNAGDLITENANEGIDSVQSSISYVLGANIEKLTLTNTAAINASGNAGNNLLIGNGSNNSLNGGLGSDTMRGGFGNDTYVVDSAGDVVIEGANSGLDTVESSVNYSLDSNLENLSLTGTSAIYGTGNSNDNWIVGNGANNILTGYAGNDTLDSGSGVDTLVGGSGNDVYIVNSSDDIVVENSGEGLDTIQSSATYILGNNTENLRLTTNSSIDGTGNSLDNVLTGNRGNNLLSGGLGNDTYIFDTLCGHDTINDANGVDTLDFSQSIQNISVDLSSSGFNYRGEDKEVQLHFAGADGSTVIADAAGNTWQALGGAVIGSVNPWLAGEKEAVLNSTGYIRTTSGFNLNTENYTARWRERFDNVSTPMYLFSGSSQFSVNVQLSAGKLTLSNSANGSTWLINSLTGNTTLQNNTWYDLELNYSATSGYQLFLNGNLELSSALTTAGYNSGGLIFGANWNGGANAVGAIADVYVTKLETLHSNNFTPQTTPYPLFGNSIAWTPNTIENIIGTSGNDTLTGDSGDNKLTGGGGNDSLIGGTGNDTYVFAEGFGTDTITDDTTSINTLDFGAFASALSVDISTTAFTQSVANSVSWGSGTIKNLITGFGNDFLTGNTANNILTAGDGNDTLIGGAGNDSLVGGAGNDTYAFASGFGTDTITDDTTSGNTLDFSAFSSALAVDLGITVFTQSTGNTVNWAANTIKNVKGGAGNDTLTGSSGDNKLTGGAGNDLLIGGAGNDTYAFASGFGTDTITDDTTSGNTLDFSAFNSALAVDLGTTVFTQSTGNTVNWAANTIKNIIGGAGNDTLTGSNGDNKLTGGAGNDLLIGGAGNDTYAFTEGFGTDTIKDDTTSINTLDFSAFTTSSINIRLDTTSFTQSTGNTVNWAANTIQNIIGSNSVNNGLIGNSSNNNLMGGIAEDDLSGFAGNDTLTGGNGNDTLTGDAGDDLLIGGSGDDNYNFLTGFGSDTIIDTEGRNTLVFHSIFGFSPIDLSQTSFTDQAFNTLNWSSNGIVNVTMAGWTTVIGNALDNVITETGGNSTIIGGAGNDTLIGQGSETYVFAPSFGMDSITDESGIDTLDFSALSGNLSVDLTGLGFSDNSGNRVDWGTSQLEKVISNAGNGTLIGNSANNILTAGGGNDTLIGGTGNDSLIGGTGNDTYIYAPNFGVDSINDSSGTDTLDFSALTSTISIDLGLTFFSESSANTIYWADSTIENVIGSSANDTITGNSGDNKLTGGAGNDSLIGGAGNDTYVFAAGFGADIISDDKTSTNTLDFSAFTSALSVDLNTTSFNQSSDNSVSWASGTIQNLTTGSGNDVLTGTTDNNMLNGGSGNNTLSGGAGSDTLVGGIDNDTYVFASSFGTDSISDAGGHNTLDFSGVNSLTYTASIRLATTSSGSVNWASSSTLFDQIIGSTGNDSISGGSGNETLIGGVGNDSLLGGAGNDTYTFASTWGSDLITDTSGIDTVDLSKITSNLAVTMWSSGGNEVSDGINLINWTSVIENLNTGSGNDTILGDNGINSITTGAGNDTIAGNGGNDTLNGGIGNDLYSYSTAWGNDSILDASGIDVLDFSYSSLNVTFRLEAGIGDEVTDGTNKINWTGNLIENVTAGSGNDTLIGNSGANFLTGGAGNDTYIFTQNWGIDTLSDASGTDTVDLSAVTSNLNVVLDSTTGTKVSDGMNSINWGSSILENIVTGSGNDTVIGTSTADFIVTAAGNDTVSSSGGNDTLNTGTGNDSLNGGAGDDTYIFAKAWGNDLIADASGTDTIDMSVVDVALTVAMWSSAGNEVTDGINMINWSGTIENFIAGSGNDSIAGSSSNDSITAGAGSDSVWANSGNDTVNGGAGNEYLDGGNGDDTYIIATGWGNDLIADASGVDTIDISAVTGNLSVSMWITGGNEVTDGTNTINWTGIMENLNAGSGNDIINCDNGANSILGGAGNDVINANNGNDTVSGGTGNDTLAGGANNDTYLFKAGDGQDSIQENDSTAGNLDTVLFDSSVGKSGIAVLMVGNYLQIGYQGNSGDLITVVNQATSSGSIERFQASDGTYMTNADVNAVIQSMTTYATNNGISLTSLNDVKNNTGLMNIVAAGWHS